MASCPDIPQCDHLKPMIDRALNLHPAHNGCSQSGGPGRQHVVAGLFAGIGGIELGLQRSGHHTALLCEADEAALNVLATRFPSAPLHTDVRELAELPAGVTLLTAGFPCQDLSQAGRLKGITGANSGLVSHVFRLLSQQRIPWLILENVPFMLQLAKGKALDVVLGALEELGYKWAYRVVDSMAFGLPQRRRRIYIVASLEGDPRDVLLADEMEAPDAPRASDVESGVSYGFYWTEGTRGLGLAVDAVPTLKGGSGLGIPSPPAALLPSGDVVKPHICDAERLQGFEAGWTEPAETATKRSARWKLVGNAVSVPVFEWIGHRLNVPGNFARPDATELPIGKPWPTCAWNVGAGRMTAKVSEWPLILRHPPLHEFLQHPPELLSERATRGFLSRARMSSLRFPRGFIDALQAHLDRMEDEPRPAVRRSA